MTMDSYILFELGESAYAIPSDAVQRMEMVEQITPVPNAPPYVDGIVFSRGRVVPAINLRRRFGFTPVAYDSRTRLIIVSLAERAVGLIVDAAREFVRIAPDSIQPPPDTLGPTSGDYLSGIATVGERVVLVLDISRILTSSELGSDRPTSTQVLS